MTVTVKRTQAGVQQGVADKFSATAEAFTPTSGTGLRTDHTIALNERIAQWKGNITSAETLAREGKDAAVEIQNGDTESGEKIAGC
jgi:hypothetical protein